MLWPQDMPAHALVALSEKDDLVPAPLVAKHILDAHATASVMYHPTAGHGGFLIDLPWQRRLVQVRRQNICDCACFNRQEKRVLMVEKGLHRVVICR